MQTTGVYREELKVEELIKGPVRHASQKEKQQIKGKVSAFVSRVLLVMRSFRLPSQKVVNNRLSCE